MTHDHGEHHDHQDHHVHDHKHADGTDCHCEPSTDELSAIDPVCGMTVDKSTTTLTADHAGERYYFCSPGCRTSFLATPKAYVG